MRSSRFFVLLAMLAAALCWSGSAFAKTNQTITFNALANQTYGVAPFTVTATATSGLAVKFTSGTTAVCTASGTNGATITIIAAGTCTINANQAGNGTYNAASQVSQSFTVFKAGQTITFASLAPRSDAARPFTVSATADSGLTVTFTSTTSTICTVSGTTVTVVADGTCIIAANQAGNGNYNAAGQVTQSFLISPFCTPPPNIPSGVNVTCTCDTFNRASINPSPMFGGTSWALSNSDGLGNPYINGTTGLLRLTENTGNNAKAATAPGIYPAAGNYISVEFNHFAYNGSGADGVAVTLSDYSVPAVPGGYGGSQGYAPEGTPGFAGGWLGVALDEYGNYSNPTEGRNGGTAATPQEVGMRGPGSGTNGYNWITGTTSNPGGLGIDNHTATVPSPGYMYQVIVDARNETSGTVNVSVNRDSTTYDGNNYASIIAPYNVYSSAVAAQSAGWISQIVPNYWQISFTSSTGGSTNIHEIGDMRICAQTVYPPSGGQASGFSAIDSAYPAASGSTVPAYQNFQTGHIYMKVVGKSFPLWVAALTSGSNAGISTAYSATTTKYVLLNLVPAGTCYKIVNNARTLVCDATCTGQTAVSGGNQILTFGTSTPGALKTAAFTLNSAYSELVAIMKECTSSACTSFTATTPACSVDTFSVRPTGVNSVTLTSPAATYKAGSGQFQLTASTTEVTGITSGYTGNLKIDNSAVMVASPGTNTGVIASPSSTTPITFSAATTGTGASTSLGQFTYSEVGGFSLNGYPDTNNAAGTYRAVYDGVTDAECNSISSGSISTSACDARKSTTWTGVDSISTKNDCNQNNYSNTIDASGKYGCNFGNIANTGTFTRFTPDHYAIVTALSTIANRTDLASCPPASNPGATNAFTYMGEPFGIGFTLQAQNAGNTITKNYQGSYVQFTDAASTWAASGNNSLGLAMAATSYPLSPGTCSVYFSATGVTSYSCTGVGNPVSVANGGVPRVAVSSTATLLPTMNWTQGVGTFTANPILQRATAGPDGPYENLNVGILPTDADGVTTTAVYANSATTVGLTLATNNSSPSPTPDRVLVGTTAELFGRLKLSSAAGSPLVSLPIPVAAQYWNGSTFVNNAPSAAYPNQYDSCTVIPGNTIGMVFKGSIAACNTSVPTSITLVNGVGALVLPAPGATHTGSVSLTALLGSPASGTTCVAAGAQSSTVAGSDPYLQGNWLSSGVYTGNPSALATFGIYTGAPKVIYIRELY